MSWRYTVPGDPNVEFSDVIYYFASQNFTVLTAYEDAPKVIEAESSTDSALGSGRSECY